MVLLFRLNALPEWDAVDMIAEKHANNLVLQTSMSEIINQKWSQNAQVAWLWTDLCLDRRLGFCILSKEKLKLLSSCFCCSRETQAQLKWLKEIHVNNGATPHLTHFVTQNCNSVFYALQTGNGQSMTTIASFMSFIFYLLLNHAWEKKKLSCRKLMVG